MEAQRNTLPVLHQFLGSHFNDKARWALDWKALAHRRVSHLPGPHAMAISRLSRQRTTPVLEIEGEVVAGSAAILERLEAFAPAPALYPEDPALCGQALALARDFDTRVGPATRAAAFSVMLSEPDFFVRIFAGHRGSVARSFYRLGARAVGAIISRSYDLGNPQRVAEAFAVSRDALDQIAKQIGPNGQLVGDRFGVADLSCAALLAPLVNPDHPDMRMPEPIPASVQAFLARWTDHEAAHWVREQYARQRPATLAV